MINQVYKTIVQAGAWQMEQTLCGKGKGSNCQGVTLVFF